MAQTAQERARAQRRTARELREDRYKITVGRDYRRAIDRMATPGAVMDHARELFATDETILAWETPVTFNIHRMTLSQRKQTLEFDNLADWKFMASIQSAGNVWWYHSMSKQYRRQWEGVEWEQ